MLQIFIPFKFYTCKVEFWFLFIAVRFLNLSDSDWIPAEARRPPSWCGSTLAGCDVTLWFVRRWRSAGWSRPPAGKALGGSPFAWWSCPAVFGSSHWSPFGRKFKSFCENTWCTCLCIFLLLETSEIKDRVKLLNVRHMLKAWLKCICFGFFYSSSFISAAGRSIL